MKKIPDITPPSEIHIIPTNNTIPAKIKINIPIPAEICVEKNNKTIIIRTPNQPIKVSPFLKKLCVADDIILFVHRHWNHLLS